MKNTLATLSAFIALLFSGLLYSPPARAQSNNITLTLSKTNAQTGESLLVRWTATTPGTGDWIALYRATPILPNVITGRVSVASVNARDVNENVFRLNDPGSYQIRYVRRVTTSPDTNPEYQTLATSPLIIVTGVTSNGFSLSTSSTNPIVRETLTLSWSTGINPITDNDWIAAYPADVNLPTLVTGSVSLASSRVTKTSGSTKFLLVGPGMIEFRYVRWEGTAQNGSNVFRTLVRSEVVVATETVANPRSITNFPSTGENIILFSDSLGVSVGAREGKGLAYRISRELCCTPILNASVTGNTTGDALARIDQDVLSKNPKIVIVQLGGNDRLQLVPKSTTLNNIREIIRRIQARGAIVVLVAVETGSLPVDYGDEFAQIARETGSALVPNVLMGIITDSRFKFDTVHPNEWGYMIMAERIAPVVAVLNNTTPLNLAERQIAEGRLALTWGVNPGLNYDLLKRSEMGGPEERVLRVSGLGQFVCELQMTNNQSFYRVRAGGGSIDSALPKAAWTKEELEALANQQQ